MIDIVTLPGYHVPTLRKCGCGGEAGMVIARCDPAAKAAAERLARGSRLPFAAIAAETGLAAATIRSWSARLGWRPARRRMRRSLEPATWSDALRAATARLYRTPEVDLGDLALALGVPHSRAEAVFAACKLTGRRWACTDAPAGVEGRALRKALHGHIGRQIARFDAALLDGAAAHLDTARVLRDLGGLKRLLDELDHDEPGGGGDGNLPGTDDARDLPALRAAIAGRYAAFAGERADAGLPSEPAAPPPAGAGG